mgnify:CR=1 FL=1
MECNVCEVEVVVVEVVVVVVEVEVVYEGVKCGSRGGLVWKVECDVYVGGSVVACTVRCTFSSSLLRRKASIALASSDSSMYCTGNKWTNRVNTVSNNWRNTHSQRGKENTEQTKTRNRK